jgi:hypothetical protein
MGVAETFSLLTTLLLLRVVLCDYSKNAGRELQYPDKVFPYGNRLDRQSYAQRT